MAEVVLDHFEAHAGVEQVGRDRVPQAVAGEVSPEPGRVAVAREQRLDAPLPQGAAASREEGRRRVDAGVEDPTQELRRRLEEHLFAPGTALGAPDQDPPALEVHVAARQERHLSYPQAVVVDQREEGLVSRRTDDAKETPYFVLREVTRQAQRDEAELWRGGWHGRGSVASARNSESVHFEAN